MDGNITNIHRGSEGMLNRNQIEDVKALVIGIGGTGSYIALALAKLGTPNIELIDFDEVEEHNTSAQLYGKELIGKPKTEAWEIATRALLPHGVAMQAFSSRFEMQNVENKTHVFACVDNMETRAEIWEAIKTTENPPILIDARIGNDFIRLHAADVRIEESKKHYEDSLYPDEEADAMECAQRNIAYVAFLCAGLVTALFAHTLRSADYPLELWHKAHDYDTIIVK